MRPDITFISSFRKFKADQDRIQRSALYSWQAAGIPLVTTATNEVNLKDKLSDPGITLVDDVRTGWHLGFKTGAVVVRDLIIEALPVCRTQMVALVPSDIIVPVDFQDRVRGILDKHGFGAFLTGSRRGIKLAYYVDSPDTLARALSEPGIVGGPGIFVASRFNMRRMAHEMPDFVMGRPGWVDWVLRWAENNVENRLNCTADLPILHCEHDRSHVTLQEGNPAPSVKHNQVLWDGARGKRGSCHQDSPLA